MPRARFMDVRLVSLLAVAALLAAGCGESASTQFRSYDQLEQAATAEDSDSRGSARQGDSSLNVGSRANDADENNAVHHASITDAARALKPGQTLQSTSDEASSRIADHGDVPAMAEKPLDEPPAPAEPRKIELLVKDRQFHTEGGALRVSYDDIDLLKILNMDPVPPEAPSLMPGWLKQLDGKRIRIRGFMYPEFEETGIEAFVLARDNEICCFGRNPKIYDLIGVRMRPGVTTNYILNRPFDVVGTFHIEPRADLDLLQLYWIDDAVVIDR